MAEYRTLHTKMWQDEWFCELAPDAKLLFVYLVTNRAASLSGIYKLPPKFIAFETGIALARVMELLGEFQQAGKVYHEDGVIWVKRLRAYQTYHGKATTQVQTRIDKDLAEIPDCALKRAYLAYYAAGADVSLPVAYPPDTHPIPTPETETETDTETEKETGRGADAPAPADPKAKLLIVQPVLQEQLARYYQSQGRSVPRHYQSDQQREAFEAVCAALGGELRALTEKAFSRQMSSLPKLLAWLEGCAKNKNGNGHRPSIPASKSNVQVSTDAGGVQKVILTPEQLAIKAQMQARRQAGQTNANR